MIGFLIFAASLNVGVVVAKLSHSPIDGLTAGAGVACALAVIVVAIRERKNP